MGLDVDQLHSYRPELTAFAVLLVIAAVLISRLGSYTLPKAAKRV